MPPPFARRLCRVYVPLPTWRCRDRRSRRIAPPVPLGAIGVVQVDLPEGLDAEPCLRATPRSAAWPSHRSTPGPRTSSARARGAGRSRRQPPAAGELAAVGLGRERDDRARRGRCSARGSSGRPRRTAPRDGWRRTESRKKTRSPARRARARGDPPAGGGLGAGVPRDRHAERLVDEVREARAVETEARRPRPEVLQAEEAARLARRAARRSAPARPCPSRAGRRRRAARRRARRSACTTSTASSSAETTGRRVPQETSSTRPVSAGVLVQPHRRPLHDRDGRPSPPARPR